MEEAVVRARTALGVQAPVSSLTRSTPRPRPCCVPAALVADRVEVAGLHAALASRIGHAHARDRDGVRQDAYAWAGDDDLGKAVLCVADGLGTQPRSHVGAQASANAAAAELVRAATNPSMVVAAAMAAIDLAAHGLRVEAEALSTTLLAVAVDTGRQLVHAVRVGDPSAYLLVGGDWQPLFDRADAEAETAANVTAALPALRPAMVWMSAPLGDATAVVLLTDGVGNYLDDGRSSWRRFCRRAGPSRWIPPTCCWTSPSTSLGATTTAPRPCCGWRRQSSRIRTPRG